MTIHLQDSPKYTLRDKRESIEIFLYLPLQGEIEGARSRVQNPVVCLLSVLVTALRLGNVDDRTGTHTYHLEIIHFRGSLQDDTPKIYNKDHMSPLYQEREDGRALDPI